MGLADGVIHSIIEKKPQNLREVKELGVVQEVAEDVFEILCQGYYESNEIQEGAPSGVTVTLVSFQRKKCVVSLLFALLGGTVTIFTGQPIVAFAASLIGLFYAKKAARAGTFSPAQVAILVHSIILGVTGITMSVELIVAVMKGSL